MPSKPEIAVMELVGAIYGGHELPTPEWLHRPAARECRDRWPLVRRIYHELTGLNLPDEMPAGESRSVDKVLKRPGEGPRIIEFDGDQHFNEYRAITLAAYPPSIALGFDRAAFLKRSQTRHARATGGWGRPRPPLFPDAGGRHQQRAFRDAVADLLPGIHGFMPTLRIGHFEVRRWVYGADAEHHMARLLATRT